MSSISNPADEAADIQSGTPWYPTGLIDTLTLRGGRRVLIRPILPQDDRLLAAMVNRASPEARQLRFPSMAPSAWSAASAEQFRQLTCVDHRRHVALVATAMEGGVEVLVGEARFRMDGRGDTAEFVLMVDEEWQRQGIANALMRNLSKAACDAGVNWLRAEVMVGNEAMLGMMERYRFCCRYDEIDPRIVHVETRSRALSARRAQTSPGFLEWMQRWLTTPQVVNRY
jgi:acetyltransferase